MGRCMRNYLYCTVEEREGAVRKRRREVRLCRCFFSLKYEGRPIMVVLM